MLNYFGGFDARVDQKYILKCIHEFYGPAPKHSIVSLVRYGKSKHVMSIRLNCLRGVLGEKGLNRLRPKTKGRDHRGKARYYGQKQNRHVEEGFQWHLHQKQL